MTLADRIAVMRGGIIQQLDTPQAIYSRPVNRFVAGFIGSPGMNFIEGECVAGGSGTFEANGVRVPLDRYEFADGLRAGKAVFGVRPEHVVLGDGAEAMPFQSDLTVEIVEPMGSDSLVWGKFGGQNLSFRIDAERAVAKGDVVRIGFDPGRASIFDAGTGERI